MIETSLYSKYIKELINREILEDEKGFATFEYVDSNLGCYITDIFVSEEFRNSDIGFGYVNKIHDIAKDKGCKYLLGTCIPTNNESTRSVQAMFKWGFRIMSSENNKIWLIRSIK